MQPTDPHFEALLVHLKEARGFDFTGYKRASLIRRVQRRMGQVGIADYRDYADYLQVHPGEFTALFNTILINVTAFFRDPEAWDFLRADVIEPLLASRPADAPIRVWTAGCASGEEAYTLAIALAEAMGTEQFRERVKIYATDVDEEQLADARQASYGERALQGVPDDLVARYFERSGSRFTFRKDLRRSVIFGRNDLVQDAPISRVDLLTCRNTLMYFNAETQAAILGRFHFALADHGVLFLGKAEMLLSHGSMFIPVDLRRRVFRKIPRTILPAGPGFTDLPRLPTSPMTRLDLLRSEAFMAGPQAQLVLTADGLVAMTNLELDSEIAESARDIGRPFRDLDLSYRPVELRRHIEQAQVERRVVRLSDVELVRGGETTSLEVQINPLTDGENNLLGVSVTFHDHTVARRLQDDLEHANQQLEAAYEELQSTNEELETTNEELQSTNDELQSINDQLRISTLRLDEANAFLETVLGGLQAGVAVVDPDLRIEMWNRQAEDMWGVRSAEVIGQHFLNLDIGLPFETLRPLLRGALGPGGAAGEVKVEAVNRRGRAIVVRVACAPLGPRNGGSLGDGAIIVMEPATAAPV